jgi:AcrR family transcriptional regulator
VKLSTRDRLIAATLDLLAAGQVPTLESAAVAAGLSRATAYRAFAGMAELQGAALQAYSAGLAEEIRIRAAEIEDALEAMEQVAALTLAGLTKDTTLRALLPAGGMAGNDIVRSMSMDFIRPILTRGQESGQVRTDLDATEMVEWLIDSYVSALLYRNMVEADARTMFRTFYVPALRAPSAAQPQEQTRAVAHHLKAALALLEN